MKNLIFESGLIRAVERKKFWYFAGFDPTSSGPLIKLSNKATIYPVDPQ